MKRLRNSTGIPDATIKQVVEFINQNLGIAGYDVECRNTPHCPMAGTAYTQGSGYHSTSRPFIVLRVGTEVIPALPKWHPLQRRAARRFPCFTHPYQYAQHKGRRVVIRNRIEALVYIAAHEMRHLWQQFRTKDNRKSKNIIPMYPNSKGKFSEVDTEAFALHELRRWRKEVV